MRFAALYTESAGYPLDDPAVMVEVAIRAVLSTCEREGVTPIGSFEMSVIETSALAGAWDCGLIWEFTPDGDTA